MLITLQRQVLRKLMSNGKLRILNLYSRPHSASFSRCVLHLCIFIENLCHDCFAFASRRYHALVFFISPWILQSFLDSADLPILTFLIIFFKKFISAPRPDFIDQDTGSNVPLSCIWWHLCIVTEHCDTLSYETCQERTCPQGRIRAGREVGSILPSHVWHSRRSIHVGWHMIGCVQGELMK